MPHGVDYFSIITCLGMFYCTYTTENVLQLQFLYVCNFICIIVLYSKKVLGLNLLGNCGCFVLSLYVLPALVWVFPGDLVSLYSRSDQMATIKCPWV